MKNKAIFFTAITFAAIMIFVLLLTACAHRDGVQYQEKLDMKEYYTIDDFSTIRLGVDTLREVYKIVPCDTFMFTHYGAVCEYPMQGGGCIRIHYYDYKKFVAKRIEVVSEDGKRRDISSTGDSLREPC